MPTYRNKKKGILKFLVFILIILNFLVPMFLIGFNIEINFNYPNHYHDSVHPKTQGFSKNDYEPILNEEKQGLGSLNITDFIFNELGFNSSKSSDLTYYNQDLSEGALNMTYKGTEFIETTKIAQVDNINENITDYEKITVTLNETINVVYNNTSVNFLMYAPRLTPFLVTQLSVENNTTPIKPVTQGNYSIEKYDSIDFLVFNYKNYYKYNALNFTMHIIWEFNLTIDSWKLTQYTEENLIIEEEDQIISPRFNYQFNLIGHEYNKTEDDTFIKILADDLWVNLTVNLPDKELLGNHILKINFKNIVVDFLNSDKSVYTKALIRVNNTNFFIDFTANYIIRFVEPVDETWAIDRLVEDKDIRERIYFPTIISGPKHIYIKYVNILEETIGFDQVKSKTSLFGRFLSYIEINVTELEEDIRNSLIFHENATKRQGIKITLPYMINGEVCPFTFKYETDKDLRVIITDNINMPIIGLDVVIYYYGEKYGTYISKDNNQPIGPTITDENGEILVEYVPNGNYTIKIYDSITDELIMEAEVSAHVDTNYVATSIWHFPLWILTFGSINGIVIGLGFIIYKKQKISK